MAQFDNISASFDGTTTSFALTISGSPVALPAKRDIDIKVGGVEHYEGTDFTIAGSTITFSVAPYPGDLFAGEYLDPANSDYALAADLASKANQSDVDTNTSAIALRATQADLDALTNTVNNLPTSGTGPIDDRVIGGTTPAAGTFTSLTSNGDIEGTNLTVDKVNLGDSINDLFYIKSTRVGIATENPDTPLHVTGRSTFDGSVDVTGDLTIDDPSPTIFLNDTDGTDQQGKMAQAGGSLVYTVRNGDSHGSIDFRSFNGSNNLLRFRVATDGDFNFYNGNGITGMKWDAPNSRLGVGTNSPSEVLHVEGNTKITGVATIDGGAKLGGTSAANLLDDYEEGSHTTLANHAGGWLTLQSGRDESNYVKVGKQVTVTGMITIDSLDGTETGAVVLSLPFAVGTWGSTYSCRAVGSVIMNPSSNVAGTLTAKANSFILTAVQGSSVATIYEGVDGGITSTNVAEYLRAGTDITYTITYLTD